jgi:hypothetical protein
VKKCVDSLFENKVVEDPELGIQKPLINWESMKTGDTNIKIIVIQVNMDY